MKNADKVKFKPMSKGATDRFYHIVFWPVWFFFNLFLPVKVTGRENIPDQGALIASNHSSNSDPLMAVIAAGYRHPLRIMAKEELFHIPVLGWLLVKLGMFGVNRGQSDITAVKRALKVLKEDCRLLVFPEGTRVTSEADSDAKNGAVMFATRAGVPIIPMYIPRKKRWFRFNRVIIGEAYYPDVPAKRATQEDYRAASEDMLRRIYALEGGSR